MNKGVNEGQTSGMSDETWNYIRQLWVESRNELDRSLFLAASAGLGFCTTLLFDKNLVADQWVMSFLLISLVAFSMTSGAVLLVFKFNADYLQRLLNYTSASNKDPRLSKLDWFAVVVFILAVFSMFAAIVTRLFFAA